MRVLTSWNMTRIDDFGSFIWSGMYPLSAEVVKYAVTSRIQQTGVSHPCHHSPLAFQRDGEVRYHCKLPGAFEGSRYLFVLLGCFMKWPRAVL